MPLIWPSELRQLGIVGMNRRNVEYIARNNERRCYPMVDNKLKTKLAATEWGIDVPELYGEVRYQYQARRLENLIADRETFVIKPAQGCGGKGILVIVGRRGNRFIKPNGCELSLRELKGHVSNILSGLFSLGGRLDVAMVEELVNFDDRFANYSYEGVPDVRVVVYKGYPVMAMLRCSTRESDGKANLHQGAVGIGIDIVSGTSICAVQHNRNVDRHPDTGHSFENLKIPQWPKILKLAAGCQEMTGLGYLGADVVLDADRGPLILEINARPGLAIQIANRIGLRKRLAEIDQLKAGPRDVDSRIADSCRLFVSR
ncbi:alpha-L-glutamate ligase-like protein [Porticoccus sp. W117]|uniref:alpha-L-glutamate ligase-like protein n=1 Tax=Porticoccus sp. W117 TaxID=3054777 RepID=UPI00259A61F0|nr:alpha-L-glutamate ligase-like protein [Porticoccus sp. W117]MDM3871161.1 alpha-L-glutamate ligase-like protein [Porticoccus sp. W117]